MNTSPKFLSFVYFISQCKSGYKYFSLIYGTLSISLLLSSCVLWGAIVVLKLLFVLLSFVAFPRDEHFHYPLDFYVHRSDPGFPLVKSHWFHWIYSWHDPLQYQNMTQNINMGFSWPGPWMPLSQEGWSNSISCWHCWGSCLPPLEQEPPHLLISLSSLRRCIREAE